MEPRLEFKVWEKQSDWKTEKKMGRWYQWIPQTRIWRKWKPNREQQSNQQNLDQHCQRPWKMGSITRNLHNDRVRMTEVKMKTQSPSQNQEKMRWWLRVKQQLRNHAPLRMHQQNEALRSSSRPAFAMGWRLMVKNNVTGSLQRWGYWVRILRTKENLEGNQEWLMSYGICQLPLRVFFFSSWFPCSWLPCLLRCVAPNPRIPRSEFVNSYQQQPVCCYVSFFFILSSSQDLMHWTLSLTVGLCTPCQ